MYGKTLGAGASSGTVLAYTGVNAGIATTFALAVIVIGALCITLASRWRKAANTSLV